jgi:murein L,D-transpeptidase YcbB/YkuD
LNATVRLATFIRNLLISGKGAGWRAGVSAALDELVLRMRQTDLQGSHGLQTARPRAWALAGVLAGLLALPGAAWAQTPAPRTPPVPAIAAAMTPPPTVRPVINLRPDQVSLLRRTLDQAESHGFEHDEFATPGLDAQLQSRDPAIRHAGQDRLMDAVVRYAQAIHAGRLTSADYLYEWGLHPAAYDAEADFDQAVAEDHLPAWLDSLPPPYTGYDALRGALTSYRTIAARGGWQTIGPGPDMALGSVDPRVPALRARLAVEDSTVAATGAPVFDDALAQGVIRAQKRFGLAPTGVVSKGTLAALNTPVNERVAQIIANMERWRWLPQELPADRIQVNIAAAVLTVFHNDTPTLSMRAVTGRPGDETPMLESQIQSVVFNPPWNVPPSIATKELWPKERANPSYFARNDFVVITNPDGSTRLQQKAGPKAALGKVKFDFANKYGVYLHDTPSHGTFGQYARMVSHGCVRLERPVVLAKAVMDGDAKWTPDAIDAALDAGDTIRAPLPKPISVFLLYWTAYVGPDGQANFRGDPYDWDRTLMQRIDAGAHSGA